MAAERKPNLFIVGAMKCGTSSLHSYLGHHPAVFMSTPKEPSHFVERATLRTVYPQMELRGYWKREKYLALFRDAGDAQVIGESSTNYAKLPQVQGVPERIAAFNPDARFIYAMRDPVRRAISHYWHLVRVQRESRDILTALREEPQYLDVSDYALQLRAFFEVFGPERVRTVVTEELVADPQGVVQDIFRWLGVDADFVPPNLDQRKGATPSGFERARTLSAVSRLHGSRIWHAIAPIVPQALKRAARLGLYRRTETEIAAVPEAPVVAYLRPILQARTDELIGLLGRDFPMWTLLYDQDAGPAAPMRSLDLGAAAGADAAIAGHRRDGSAP